MPTTPSPSSANERVGAEPTQTGDPNRCETVNGAPKEAEAGLDHESRVPEASARARARYADVFERLGE